MCRAVHTSVLHRVHMASVVILHLQMLVGDASVSYVEARQKEVRLAGIPIKKVQEVLLNIVYPSCPLTLTCSWTALEKA